MQIKKCPTGLLTENSLVEIYSQIFSCGDCTIFAKHLFAAMIQQNRICRSAACISTNSSPSPLSELNIKTSLNFRDFLIVLSVLSRGSIDERIHFLFNFYDLNRDGKISTDVFTNLFSFSLLNVY